MKLNEKITKLRKAKGMSQEDLANELGVSRQSVFKWEAGENSPDLDKLKKITKLFNVSFDTLLDDGAVIEEKEVEEKPEPIEKKTIEKGHFQYRETFDSGFRISTPHLANSEHGFIEGIKKLDDDIFTTKMQNHMNVILKQGFTKLIRIQHDVCVDFFIDDKNKTFGFFFEGAIQFLCPYENFSGFFITNSSPTTGYTRAPAVGVGFGRNQSLAIGSMPIGQARPPLFYYLTISYFDASKSIKTYKASFACNRRYTVCDGTVGSPEELYLWEGALSEETNRKLNEISAYLNGVRDMGSQIKNGEIAVNPINTSILASEVKKARAKELEEAVAYTEEVNTNRKKRRRKVAIISLVVVSLIAGTITTCCSIAAASRTAEVNRFNRSKAQNVINLIDSIGEVTLSSADRINKAIYAYNALTSDQQKLVTNYDKLVNARSQYEKLYSESENEKTKDDPTRTIVINDLNGRWISNENEEWAIDDIQGSKAVLYWTSTYPYGGIISGAKSSYLVGYNNQTRRMEAKLYYSQGYNYLDIKLTKSSSNLLTMYYSNQVFHKISY